MTTLAVSRFVTVIRTKPLVQGFVGAMLAMLLSFAAYRAYGWARWEAYGKNEARVTALEQTQARIIAYLQAQEAKGAK